MTKDRLLIYGANGHVGEALARLATSQGLEPILAGRDAGAVEGLAGELGLEARVFSLDDPTALDRALTGVRAVLNLAGPYVRTWEPLVDSCLRTLTHYLDITGELPVLEAMAALGGDAAERGVTLLPAVGLDSVPSDCLAAHLVRRLPGATRLTLGLRTTGPAGLPPGTQKTMIELAHLPDRVIRGGEPVTLPGLLVASREIDFGEGPVPALRFQAADPYMAWRTTGMPDIEMFVALPLTMRLGYRLVRLARPAFRWAWLRRALQRLALPGASAAALSRSSTQVWAEARDPAGNVVRARLDGPEGAVVWTTRSALAAARRVLDGRAPVGFQTPAGAFGPDFVLECEGVERVDLA
ncbi:MAG: saccharopine dehydrogenase NADP-binding domain-containing protein [Trueperaceae bacterium]|nr:saccharopine dehydrogenase NADP-binding domain-containing protein [Trueperaceae bacterium]